MAETQGFKRQASVHTKFRISLFRTLRSDWLARAACLPGRTLHYALAIHNLASLRGSATVVVNGSTLARFGVTREVAGEALTRLVEEGLVKADRGRGSSPVVTLLEPGGKVLMLSDQ
jgi:hypothetical protein